VGTHLHQENRDRPLNKCGIYATKLKLSKEFPGFLAKVLNFQNFEICSLERMCKKNEYYS
jgi:hypothetical protein